MNGTTTKTFVLLMLLAGMLRANEEMLSLSPSVVMLRGETGQTTKQTLSFTNGTSQPVSFEMMAQDVVVRDGKRLFVEGGTLPGSIAATAVFSQRRFTVPAGLSVPIDLTVTIPPRAAVRAIVVMCHGTTKFGGGPVRMTASVGTLMTFALTGDVIAAEASAMDVHPPTASSNFFAAQRLTNSGTEPVVVTGMLAILDSAGTLVGKQGIPAWRMLPGERTAVRVEYGGDLPSGHYRALVSYDLTDKTVTSNAEFSVR
jgi:hypothetical protein